MGAGGVYAAARRDEWCCWAVGFTELGAREGNEWPNGGKASPAHGLAYEWAWGFPFRFYDFLFLSAAARESKFS